MTGLGSGVAGMEEGIWGQIWICCGGSEWGREGAREGKRRVKDD